MRILVSGGTGMLGTDVVSTLVARGHTVVSPPRSELDITDPVSTARIATGDFGTLDWVVNCAAYTAVDRAESEEQIATEINGFGPGYLARSAALAGAKMVHVSTDFVFDGRTETPYDEDSPTNPLGVYGRSKLAGETSALGANPNTLIVRTAWLYGPNGNSFPRTMIRAYEAGKSLKVVQDQKGSPTYTGDLARVIADLVDRNAFPGVYHAAGPDVMTWLDLAERTIETWSGKAPEITPIETKDWPTPATRPAYSALTSKNLPALGIAPMRPTREALTEFCARLREVW
jgi:dTDP-4-dehydrorhamnose reductase